MRSASAYCTRLRALPIIVGGTCSCQMVEHFRQRQCLEFTKVCLGVFRIALLA